MRWALAVLTLFPLTAACTDAAGGPPVPPDSAVPTSDGEAIGYMEACTVGMDELCETGLCFDFNTKGPHCTHACTVDTDCEAPSTGCNGMGVCKAPGGGTGGGTGG